MSFVKVPQQSWSLHVTMEQPKTKFFQAFCMLRHLLRYLLSNMIQETSLQINENMSRISLSEMNSFSISHFWNFLILVISEWSFL